MNFVAILNDTVLFFTWDPPAEDERNGEIVSYTLSCDINDDLQFELSLIDIEEISLGVYRVDSTYTCKIYASTSGGAGPAASLTLNTGSKQFILMTVSMEYYILPY